jgi:hypothetical protein
MAEWLQAEISVEGSDNDASEPQVNKLNEIYFKLNTLPITLFDFKFRYKVSISVLSKQ